MSADRIVVGIDEAGYGPRLGPLVVGLAAFRIPAGAPSVRALLPLTSKAAGPCPVDDSKRIYRAGDGLATLERSVLAFAGFARRARVPDPPGERLPWGLPWPPALPVAAPEEALAASRAALGEGLRAGGVEVLAVETLAVGVGEFNAGVARTGSKARVLFDAAMDLLAPWLSEPGEVSVHVDRHGGRARYLPLLLGRFPDRLPAVVREGRDVSSYRLRRPGGDVTIAFEVEGDRLHLSTALASMSAKYVRELHMGALNEHFRAHDPELRPTAGYPVDADRWLAETATLRGRLGIADEVFVRCR